MAGVRIRGDAARFFPGLGLRIAAPENGSLPVQPTARLRLAARATVKAW